MAVHSDSTNLASLILPSAADSLIPRRPSWLQKGGASGATVASDTILNNTVGKAEPPNFKDLDHLDIESASTTSRRQKRRSVPKRKRKSGRKIQKKRLKKPKKRIIRKKTTKRKKPTRKWRRNR